MDYINIFGINNFNFFVSFIFLLYNVLHNIKERFKTFTSLPSNAMLINTKYNVHDSTIILKVEWCMSIILSLIIKTCMRLS
jgi:fumarate reductase subunit C